MVYIVVGAVDYDNILDHYQNNNVNNNDNVSFVNNK